MKVAPIKKLIFSEGSWTGLPCTGIILSKEGEEKDLNTIVSEVLAIKNKFVLIRGILKDNPDIKTLIVGLSSKGKVIIFVTDVSDNIGPIRPVKNLKLFIRMIPPTGSSNDIDARNFPLFQELDEVKVLVGNMEDYENAKKFLSARVITRPTILFSLAENCKNSEEIVSKYLSECDSLHFKNRISKPITL